ncbi:MAG: hypothetical protein AAGC85_10235 [Bacteroidota bacterium]
MKGPLLLTVFFLIEYLLPHPLIATQVPDIDPVLVAVKKKNHDINMRYQEGEWIVIRLHDEYVSKRGLLSNITIDSLTVGRERIAVNDIHSIRKGTKNGLKKGILLLLGYGILGLSLGLIALSLWAGKEYGSEYFLFGFGGLFTSWGGIALTRIPKRFKSDRFFFMSKLQ